MIYLEILFIIVAGKKFLRYLRMNGNPNNLQIIVWKKFDSELFIRDLKKNFSFIYFKLR